MLASSGDNGPLATSETACLNLSWTRLTVAAAPVVRRPFLAGCHSPLHHRSPPQVLPNQSQHPLVPDHAADPAHQNVVIDVVEELCDIYIHHPVLPFLRILLCGSHGVLCASPRSESVARLAELRIEDRRQRLQHHLLNAPILYRRDSQHPCATARFGYFYLPHRAWNIGSRQQLRPNLFPVRLKMLLQFLRRHPVDPRRPFVAFYRSQSQRAVLVRYNFFHQALVHRSLSEGSRNGVSSPSPLAPRGCTVSASGMGGAATVVDALRHSGLFGPFQFPL